MKLYENYETQEAIDEQFDIESQLDMQSYGEWLVNHSERARFDLNCTLDARFGPTLDEAMDIFPAREPNSPVFVFIHGGWWRSLSNKEFSLVARGLVAHGITVVVTNYSLCPKVGIPEITRQSRAALAWVYRHIDRFNGNRDSIFVAGHSAGGHQVGMVAITDWEGEYGLPNDLIKGGVPISGLFDLRPFAYSWLQPKLLLTQPVIERESPLLHASAVPRRMPLLVTLGGDESVEFHRQSERMVEAWRKHGGIAETLDQPGMNHITAIEGFEDPDSELCKAVVSFIQKYDRARA